MNKDRKRSIAIIFIILIFMLTSFIFYNLYLEIENGKLKQENKNLKENLGYISGEVIPYGPHINVSCRIPLEVLEKNWIYQIYTIEGNNTCYLINEAEEVLNG